MRQSRLQARRPPSTTDLTSVQAYVYALVLHDWSTSRTSSAHVHMHEHIYAHQPMCTCAALHRCCRLELRWYLGFRTIWWAYEIDDVSGRVTLRSLEELNDAWALEANEELRTYVQRLHKKRAPQVRVGPRGAAPSISTARDGGYQRSRSAAQILPGAQQQRPSVPAAADDGDGAQQGRAQRSADGAPSPACVKNA